MDHSNNNDFPLPEVHSTTNQRASTVQNVFPVRRTNISSFQSSLQPQNTGRVSKDRPHIYRFRISPPQSSGFEFQESEYTAQAAAVFQSIPSTSASQQNSANVNNSYTIEDVCPEPADATDILYVEQCSK